MNIKNILVILIILSSINFVIAEGISVNKESTPKVLITNEEFLQDDYTLESSSINKDILTLDVSYGGGCEEHSFILKWNGGFDKSLPAQASLYLFHDSHNDTCKALITKVLKFDLSPIKETYKNRYGNEDETIIINYYDIDNNKNRLIYDIIEIYKNEPEQPIAPLEGVKEGISGEVGPEKDGVKQPIAPLEGTKDALKTSGLDCKEYLAECESGNNILCIKWGTNCREKDETKVGVKDEIKFKDEKVYINDKEVKVMPDTASEKAIATLQLKKEIEIELKDTGKPTYEITGEKEVKLFGLFKKGMSIKTEINAETGYIEKTKKPWWSFLAKE
jgi:hypothetical protein